VYGCGDNGGYAKQDSGTLADGGAATEGGTTLTTVDGGFSAIDVITATDLIPPIDAPSPIDAPASTDTGNTGNCDYPKCFVDLVKGCAPTAAESCVDQTSTIGTTGTSTAICYDNGVKQLTETTLTFDIGTMTMSGTTVSSWKNAAGLCYSMEAPYSTTSIGSLTYTVKNATGVTVATLVIDATAGTQTITCTGQAPVVLPKNCDLGGGGLTCTPGSCAF